MVRRIRWSLPTALLLGAIFLLSGCFQPEPNEPPVARFSVTLHQRYAPITVLFDASDSYDPDGRIVSIIWDFGDGKTGTGSTISHTYAEPGTYTVELRILDNRGEKDSSTAEILALEVPQGYLLRHYEWEYQKDPQYWDVLLPEATYRLYHEHPRQPFVDNYNYDNYVLDPLDEPTLEDLAQALLNRVEGNYESFVECTLSFVQGATQYTPDPEGFEYPLYPLETLVDGIGDCEDTTILYVSLVRALGYPVSMAHVDTDHDNTPDHVLALIPVSSSYPDSVTCSTGMSQGFLKIDGQLYALAETAANPDQRGYIPLGCDPWGLSESDFKRIWNL